MEIKGNGLEVREAPKARGLEVPVFAGTVAVEATQDIKLNPGDVKESLFGQLDTAFDGYMAVAEQINASRKKKEQFKVADPETVEAEFITWLTDEKAEYIARAQEADPDLHFTVIATPNNLQITPEEAEALAVEFGKNQPYPTYMCSRILKRYSASELSGTDPNNGNKLRFAAVPSKPIPELYDTVWSQRHFLAELQADMPDLRVASHLDDLVHWYTLRAGGDNLIHSGAYERTYSRRFDLSQRRIDGQGYVLCSYVNCDGEPNVSESFVHYKIDGRALVG